MLKRSFTTDMRSMKNSFERTTFKKLKRYGKVDYEQVKLSYTSKHIYLPDFRISWLRRGVYQTTYVETKGYFDPRDRQKHLLIRDQYPDLDIRILFYSDNKITKRSKTRYSDWCRKNNILYAIKDIPETWFSSNDPRATLGSITGCSPSVGIE